MQPISWVDIIGLVVLPIIGYVLTRIGGIQKELDAHKLNVAENYTKKSELTEALNKIEKILERIFEKLDTLSERRHDSGHSET